MPKTKRRGVTRTQKIGEITKRQFRSDVRKLKRLCENNAINLASFDDAEEDWICILSESEYEIGSLKHSCSCDLENYFVSQDALNILHKITTKYDDIV